LRLSLRTRLTCLRVAGRGQPSHRSPQEVPAAERDAGHRLGGQHPSRQPNRAIAWTAVDPPAGPPRQPPAPPPTPRPPLSPPPLTRVPANHPSCAPSTTPPPNPGPHARRPHKRNGKRRPRRSQRAPVRPITPRFGRLDGCVALSQRPPREASPLEYDLRVNA